MQNLFTVNPNATEADIHDGILQRAVKAEAVLFALAQDGCEGSFGMSDEMILNSIWAARGLLDEISSLASHPSLGKRQS